MKIEGYNVVLNKNITFRSANGSDVNLDGSIVPDGYIVFVKIEDCKVNNENGRQYYNSENSPAIPLLYLESWYGMGQFKTRKTFKGIEIEGKFVNEYEQAPMYFAFNGLVYIGSLKNIINQ